MKNLKITGDKLKELWGSGKILKIAGNMYYANKMSYGNYFLEPVGLKWGEKDNFAPGTIWLTKDKTKDVYYNVRELLLKL